jgi:hypothetical protein
MRALFVICGAGMFLPAFGATIYCGAGSVPVTAGLIANCNYSLEFDFGTNPLPTGGQLDLDAFNAGYNANSGEWIFELEFGFPQPAKGTTVLQFTATAPEDAAGGGTFNLLGFALQAQGSDFSIDEQFPGSNLPDLVLNHSGTANLGCGLDQLCSQPIHVNGPLLVVTTITDSAGDLAGFNEFFIAPEPSSWISIAACLLCTGAVLRRVGSGPMRSRSPLANTGPFC